MAAGQRLHDPGAPHVALRRRELLGLRLDEPLKVAGYADALDEAALERLAALGLADVARAPVGTTTQIALTPRGRRLGGGVTAELLA